MMRSFLFMNVGRRLIWILSFLVLISCSQTDQGPQPQRVVLLCSDFYQLETGESFKAVAKVFSDSGPIDAVVKWSSSDPAVAEVRSDGSVVAMSVGMAKIIGSVGDISADIDVEVVPTLVSFDVKESSVEMIVDEEFQIELVPYPEGAAIREFSCRSLDEEVVKVISDDGLIKAVGYGATKVRVSVMSLEKDVDVKVVGKTSNEGYTDGGNGVWE